MLVLHKLLYLGLFCFSFLCVSEVALFVSVLLDFLLLSLHF